MPSQRNRVLLIEGRYALALLNPKPADKDHSILNYYPISSFEIPLSELSHIYTYIHLIDSLLTPFAYDILRSQQQLGYILFSFIQSFGNTIGYSFVIQGNKENPLAMDQAIETCISDFDAYLQDLSEEKLALVISGVHSKVSSPDSDLKKRTDRIWFYITDRNEQYEVKEAILKILDSG